MRKGRIFSCIFACLLVAPAFAQAAPSPSGPSMDKAELSKSCSAQADAKGLHGKTRKHFRSQCKHGKS